MADNYSNKQNAVRAARKEGLDPSALEFFPGEGGRWAWRPREGTGSAGEPAAAPVGSPGDAAARAAGFEDEADRAQAIACGAAWEPEDAGAAVGGTGGETVTPAEQTARDSMPLVRVVCGTFDAVLPGVTPEECLRLAAEQGVTLEVRDGDTDEVLETVEPPDAPEERDTFVPRPDPGSGLMVRIVLAGGDPDEGDYGLSTLARARQLAPGLAASEGAAVALEDDATGEEVERFEPERPAVAHGEVPPEEEAATADGGPPPPAGGEEDDGPGVDVEVHEAARRLQRDLEAGHRAAADAEFAARDRGEDEADAAAARSALARIAVDPGSVVRGAALAARLAALEAEDDDGCPRGDPDCLGNNGDCHDACSTSAEREGEARRILAEGAARAAAAPEGGGDPSRSDEALVMAARAQARVFAGSGNPEVAWLIDEMARRLAARPAPAAALPVPPKAPRAPRPGGGGGGRKPRDFSAGKPVIKSEANRHVQKLIDRIAEADPEALRAWKPFSRASTYYALAGDFLDWRLAQAGASQS